MAQTNATVQPSVTARIRQYLIIEPKLDMRQVVTALKKDGYTEKREGGFAALYYNARGGLKTKPALAAEKKAAKEAVPADLFLLNGQAKAPVAPPPAAAPAAAAPQVKEADLGSTTTPLQLAVRLSKLSKSIGGLEHLESLATACKTHTPESLDVAVKLANEIGLDRFVRLAKTPGEQTALQLCKQFGHETFAEVVAALDEIEVTGDDAAGLAGATPPTEE